MRFPLAVSLIFAATLAVGCGGSSQNDAADTTREPPAPAVQPSASPVATDIGVGPVQHVDIAALDTSVGLQGEEIFNTKCSACHKLEERYIGPALEGVTTRRKPEWILNMILNPDVMVKEDPTAKGLLAEYLAPMTDFNLTEEQAKSVLVYLLEHDRSIPDHEADAGDGGE